MKQKEQNNTMLYVMVFVGLVVIGALKAGFAYLFAGVDVVSYSIVEMVGIALVAGLILFVVQQLTGRSEKLGDEIELLNKEIEKLRLANEKLQLATAAGTVDRSKLPSQRAAASTPAPAPTPVAPVVAAPPPPPPPKPKTPEEMLEEQLEHEIEAIHFDNIFAEYQAERDEAIARGENVDDGDAGTFISD